MGAVASCGAPKSAPQASDGRGRQASDATTAILSSDPSRTGVNLPLLKLIQRAHTSGSDARTEQVIESFIKPTTASSHSSYCDMMAGKRDTNGVPHKGASYDPPPSFTNMSAPSNSMQLGAEGTLTLSCRYVAPRTWHVVQSGSPQQSSILRLGSLSGGCGLRGMVLTKASSGRAGGTTG